MQAESSRVLTIVSTSILSLAHSVIQAQVARGVVGLWDVRQLHGWREAGRHGAVRQRLLVLVLWVLVMLMMRMVLVMAVVVTVAMAVPVAVRMAGLPLRHTALRRLHTASLRGAHAGLLEHAASASIVHYRTGHLLGHSTAALTVAATGGEVAIGTAALGGGARSCSRATNAVTQRGVVTAGILVILRGALDAT